MPLMAPNLMSFLMPDREGAYGGPYNPWLEHIHRIGANYLKLLALSTAMQRDRLHVYRDMGKACGEPKILQRIQEYLEKIAELVRAVKAGHGSEYPPTMTTTGRKALYDNLAQDEAATMAVDEAIRSTAQTGWRGNKMKERMLRRKLLEILDAEDAVDSIIEIIRSHDEY